MALNTQSSLQKFCKLQKKISLYLQRQSTSNINQESEKTRLSAQKITRKFVAQNKLILSEKKLENPKKFEWLTKSISNSKKRCQSSALISQNASIRQSFSNLKKVRSKTDSLIDKSKTESSEIDILSAWNEKSDKLRDQCDSRTENFDDPFVKERKSVTPLKSRLISQQKSFTLLREIHINKKMMIKSKSFESKSSIIDKENQCGSRQQKQNLKKVVQMENKKSSFVKRKKILQSDKKNERNLKQKQKSSKFLLSGFNPMDSIEQNNLLDTICDKKFNFELTEQPRIRKCIKTLKKEYICLSKESKKQETEYLKKNRKTKEEIKVEPWNFAKQENEQDYEVIHFQI